MVKIPLLISNQKTYPMQNTEYYNTVVGRNQPVSNSLSNKTDPTITTSNALNVHSSYRKTKVKEK